MKPRVYRADVYMRLQRPDTRTRQNRMLDGFREVARILELPPDLRPPITPAAGWPGPVASPRDDLPF